MALADRVGGLLQNDHQVCVNVAEDLIVCMCCRHVFQAPITQLVALTSDGHISQGQGKATQMRTSLRLQGFLENARQQRAAGLAAVQLAQMMHELVKARRAGVTLQVSVVWLVFKDTLRCL